MKIPAPCLSLLPLLVASSTCGQEILFDFENAPLHTPLPLDLTVNGLTARLSATGQGYSIQEANTMGFTPAGFAGRCIYPSSVYASDLIVDFSAPLTSFSVLYAPQELACDSSARMRVTAYNGTTSVGSSTKVADPPGTWPSATLAISSTAPFNHVVVHYDAPPPTGGDWGPIFLADNMAVTPAPPALRVTVSGPGTALVAWPLFFASYTLQQNTGFATNNWSTVTNRLNIVGDECQVPLPTTGTPMFYRLFHP
jgi:hypothetical protein